MNPVSEFLSGAMSVQSPERNESDSSDSDFLKKIIPDDDRFARAEYDSIEKKLKDKGVIKNQQEIIGAELTSANANAVKARESLTSTSYATGSIGESHVIDQLYDLRWFAVGALSYKNSDLAFPSNDLVSPIKVNDSVYLVSVGFFGDFSIQNSNSVTNLSEKFVGQLLSQKNQIEGSPRMQKDESVMSNSLLKLPEYLKKKFTFLVREGELHVIVRDYKLSHEEKMILSQEIVEQLKAQNGSISSLMINGQYQSTKFKGGI